MNPEYRQLNIGLLGIGLAAYWPQFEGLQERLQGYLDDVEQQVRGEKRRITNYGLIDSPQLATRVGHLCRKDDVDVLLVYVTTYALSANLLPLIQHAKLPVLLLNLQPEPAIDYKSVNAMSSRTKMTGEWLAFCNACPVPEISNVLTRLNIAFDVVTGVLRNDKQCWDDIENWLQAAEVVKILAHSRLGLMGGYYSGMLDIATDLTQLCGTFGIQIEQLEVDELSSLRTQMSKAQITEARKAFDEFFHVEADCDESELQRAAITASALNHFVGSHDLDLLAYYHKGCGNPANEDTMTSIILGASMLTGHGIPVAGEYEVKNVVAMKILDCLNSGGSFSEYYAIDFTEDTVLLGHDGPGHISIAQDKIRVRPLQVYHGKIGKGLSVEMSVRNGPVTLLSVAEDATHGFKFVVAEGESVPGEILEIGNTNGRYRFKIGARAFVNRWNAQGPAHHCAIGVGHIAEKLRYTASLLNVPFVHVC